MGWGGMWWGAGAHTAVLRFGGWARQSQKEWGGAHDGQMLVYLIVILPIFHLIQNLFHFICSRDAVSPNVSPGGGHPCAAMT